MAERINQRNETIDWMLIRPDYEEPALVILDQTRLPGEEVYLRLRTPEELWEAIYHLKVRGAPAIGIAAAFGLAVYVQTWEEAEYDGFYERFCRLKEYLDGSRPTAVNLFAALNRMEQCVCRNRYQSIDEIKLCLREEAEQIRQEEVAACRRIGEWGLKVLSPGMGLLTHCNAGLLAVSEYGTALAPIYLGHTLGYDFQVYADETRPLLQGARLTAFELQRAGVDVTLICDNMAATVMQQGKIQAVLVGCDRVAANGDTANKIGTLGVAILAHHYRIPFYVLGPVSTIDLACPSGKEIEIEARKPEEVTEKWYTQRMAPAGVKVYNPAFDVTPHELITAIITDQGIVRPPYTAGLREIKG